MKVYIQHKKNTNTTIGKLKDGEKKRECYKNDDHRVDHTERTVYS